MFLVYSASNFLAPTGGEVILTLLGLAYLLVVLALTVLLVVVLLTWHRKNKLRIIELEFEEEAIRRKKAERLQS